MNTILPIYPVCRTPVAGRQHHPPENHIGFVLTRQGGEAETRHIPEDRTDPESTQTVTIQTLILQSQSGSRSYGTGPAPPYGLTAHAAPAGSGRPEMHTASV